MPASPVLAGLTRTKGGGLFGFNGLPSSFADGVPTTDFGQIAISGEVPVTYLSGLPLTADERVSIEFAAPVVFNGKWPITAAGKLAVVAETTSAVASFQNGFGYAATGEIVQLENVSELPVILGPEIVPSTIFTQWTDPTVPDGWTLNIATGPTVFVEQAGVTSGLHYYSESAVLDVSIFGGVLTVGKDYQVEYRYLEKPSGSLITIGGLGNVLMDAPARRMARFDVTALTPSVAFRRTGAGLVDVYLAHFSVRELIPGTL